jgi:hypothetical protein
MYWRVPRVHLISTIFKIVDSFQFQIKFGLTVIRIVENDTNNHNFYQILLEYIHKLFLPFTLFEKV